MVVVEGLCSTMPRAWVQLWLPREAHRVRLVRRLAGRHCEEVRARWTLRRRQVWLRALQW